jgi:hypothetical protein
MLANELSMGELIHPNHLIATPTASLRERGSIRKNDYFSLIFWECRLGLAPTNTPEPWENASRDAA